MKFCVPTPAWTLAAIGKIVTTMLGAVVTVIVATPVFLSSLNDAAVSITVAGFGIVFGAVYVTPFTVAFVREPQDAPEQPVPESAQVTPRSSGSLDTTAAKF